MGSGWDIAWLGSHSRAGPSPCPPADLPPLQVPAERYLFMKLTYTDDTPEVGTTHGGVGLQTPCRLCHTTPPAWHRSMNRAHSAVSSLQDYEPPMFAPAADGGVGCFSRMPFVM